MWLFFIFIIVPMIEIGLFIEVGGLIGLWPTLAIIVIMAVFGTWLLRTQGALAFADLRRSMAEMRDPTEPMAHGAMILLAGILMVTPGVGQAYPDRDRRQPRCRRGTARTKGAGCGCDRRGIHQPGRKKPTRRAIGLDPPLRRA
jgi:hypothetical protein